MPLQLSLPIETFKLTIQDAARNIINQVSEEILYPMIHVGLSSRSFVPLKLNQPEFQYTLKQFTDKTDEVSKSKLFAEIDQLVNPEKYFEC